MNKKEEMKEQLITHDLSRSSCQEEEDALGDMNRISEPINEDDQEVPNDEQEHEKPYTDLGNIPANVPIESLLGEDFMLVPNSTRKALIAKWDQEKKIHFLSNKDKEQLKNRNLLSLWEDTAKAIQDDKTKQPMNNTPPICYKFVWQMFRLLLLVVLLYIEFVVCQIFLMNVVIIGLCVWLHLKTMVFSNGMYKNKMYSYRHRKFKQFLQEEKSKYGLVELIPGKEGKWIEIKLEEEENDDIGDNFSSYQNFNLGKAAQPTAQ